MYGTKIGWVGICKWLKYGSLGDGIDSEEYDYKRDIGMNYPWRIVSLKTIWFVAVLKNLQSTSYLVGVGAYIGVLKLGF